LFSGEKFYSGVFSKFLPLGIVEMNSDSMNVIQKNVEMNSDSMNVIQKNQGNEKRCSRCGRFHKTFSQCPAQGKQCFPL
jgi:hypothetical protein